MPEVAVQQTDAPSGRGSRLSLSQQAALLPERLYQIPAANLVVAFDVSDSADAAGVRQALSGTLHAHEILRSVYPTDRRIPHRELLPVPDDLLEVAPLEPGQLQARLAADAAEPFNLAVEIPVRVRLYQMAERQVLCLVVHPVAADDLAVDLLAREIFERCSGVKASTGSSGPSGGSSQYQEFVSAQLRSLTAKPATDPDLAYWTERLAGLPLAPRAHLTERSTAMTQRQLSIDAATMAALQAAVPGADPTAVIVALIASVMVCADPGDDIAVGLVDPARGEPGAETAIGNFANHLVLRLSASGGRTVRELIGEAAAEVAGARAHASTRVEVVTHAIRGSGGQSLGPLFAILLRVHEVGSASGETPWTQIWRRIARPAGVDLVVDATVSAAGVRLRIEFPVELAELPGIEAFVSCLASRPREWAARPDAVVVDKAMTNSIFSGPLEPEQDALRGCGGAPVTETERILADAIWQVLGLEGEPIGREDTFFSLGGDSISALRLVALLAENGYPAEVRTVFASPQVCEFAAELDHATGSDDVGAAVPAQEFAPMSASGLDESALRSLSGRFSAR